MLKFQDLTQHEVEALKQKYNFADAHTHQSQSPSQLEIVRSLPQLWLEAEQTKQETLNNKFIETFYKMRGLAAALNPNNVMLYYAASIATIHIANYLLKNRLSVSLIAVAVQVGGHRHDAQRQVVSGGGDRLGVH